MKLEIGKLSNQYTIRRLSEPDIPQIVALCQGNPRYYEFCPPFVSEASIRSDIGALPPDTPPNHKYYLGYFDGDRLAAILDLILAFPNETTAYIGFFMTDASLQNHGVGSRIIADLCACLADIGFSSVRLGWAKDNPQAEHFWRKNGFIKTGEMVERDRFTAVMAQRSLCRE